MARTWYLSTYHEQTKKKQWQTKLSKKIGQTMLWDIYVEKHCRQTMVSNIYARHSDEKFLEATICYRFCLLQKLCFSTASLSVWEFLEPLLTQNMSFFKSSQKKQFIMNTKIIIETKSSLSSCKIPEVKKKYSFKWKIHAVVWRPSWLCRECLNISLKHHFSQFYGPNKFLKGE